MKKSMILITVFILIFTMILGINYKIYAEQDNTEIKQETNKTLSETPGFLVEMKENQAETLEEYKEKYGSESYGFTAYILHLVQIYSIPFCFIGIVISIIYRVVIGARNMENIEKGLGMMVAIITITIICQVLPLVFAIVVKVGKE